MGRGGARGYDFGRIAGARGTFKDENLQEYKRRPARGCQQWDKPNERVEMLGLGRVETNVWGLDSETGCAISDPRPAEL